MDSRFVNYKFSLRKLQPPILLIADFELTSLVKDFQFVRSDRFANYSKPLLRFKKKKRTIKFEVNDDIGETEARLGQVASEHRTKTLES